jgi:hypothetical protein
MSWWGYGIINNTRRSREKLLRRNKPFQYLGRRYRQLTEKEVLMSVDVLL